MKNSGAFWQIVAVPGVLLVLLLVIAPARVESQETASFWSNEVEVPMALAGQVELTSCDTEECGSICHSDEKLLGLFRHSEPCFDKFISPMTNPVFFEDPRTLTEARLIYLNHNVPAAAGGGDIQLLAVQLRAALTERLSLVASKDGYAISTNALIDDGWADVAAGLKYNLFADAESQRLLSVGLSYELPVGSPRTLQGNGDGEFHLYTTGGAEVFDFGHWISALGVRQPVDNGAESSMMYWSNHFDYEVHDGWYALTEVNWFHWLEAGDNTALAGVEGGDLFNFGSTGVSGNDIVTQAVGLKYKRNRNRELGAAFEFPLTTRKDVIDSRLTVDWIFRY